MTTALAVYRNGIDQISSDNLNSFMQTCDSMAQLRGFPANNTAISVFVRGTSTPNDGGQGTFYWNLAISIDDNGVTTVVPNGVTSGCWTRESTGTTLLATSTTSVTIGTGSKTFTVATSNAPLTPGGFVVIASQANVANYMAGQITSYSGGILTVSVTNTGGSGTFADWSIILSGAQGSSGSAPAFNTITNGTNTTAAMVVGTGSSLAVAGTGTIAATSSLVSNALQSATTTVSVSAATAPTNGQVLTATSSTTATWQSPAAGSSAVILLSTQAASGASIIFDNTLITGTYDNYRIICYGLSASGTTDLLLDMAVAGTYGALSYSQTITTNAGGASNFSSPGGNTNVGITRPGQSYLTTNPVTRAWIDLAGLTSNVQASGHSNCGAAANQIINDFIISIAAVMNGIKIYPAAGTFTAGVIKLYGVL